MVLRLGIREKPFDGAVLRCAALVCMLLDHLWGTIVPGNAWMNYVGRLAFPIFAFQLAEGYFHTSDFRRYALRLLAFGLISEIPFNLMVSGGWFFPFHQNVMFTLLLGLLALRFADRAVREKRVLLLLAACVLCLAAAITFTDYGAYGVMMVLLFGMCRGVRGEKLWQLVGMVLINAVLFEGQTMFIGSMELPVQSFAVLALPLIWLYNGKKGPDHRWIRLGSYWFYPIHMILLYFVWRLT